LVKIRSHTELDVYSRAFEAAMQIFGLSQSFPSVERYSLTDQMRRSSRSVCANIAEAWRKRRYVAAFVSKLSDAEAESAETQVWLQFSVKCGYVQRATAASLYERYDAITGTLVGMINHPETWILTPR
jgi:four helix bundle protein